MRVAGVVDARLDRLVERVALGRLQTEVLGVVLKRDNGGNTRSARRTYTITVRQASLGRYQRNHSHYTTCLDW